MDKLTLVSVGDHDVGKTCLFISYTANSYPDVYVRVNFYNYISQIVVDEKLYRVDLWDTSDMGEDVFGLRPLSYPETDVFIFVFSIENKASLKNVEERWWPEVRHNCPYVPAILVANKIDLRNTSERTDLITTKEGTEVAKKLGFHAYCEVSAMAIEGLKELFETAIREAKYHIELRQKIKRSLGIFGKTKKNIPVPVPPIRPVADKFPVIEIEASTFSEDWRKVLQNCHNTDVTFIVEGEHKLEAHRLVICAASVFFKDLLGFKLHNKMEDESSVKQCNKDDVAKVIESDGAQCITIQLGNNIDFKTFQHVLQFLYTGDPMISKNDSSASKENIKVLCKVAIMLELSLLDTICNNILNDQDFLNKKLISELNEGTGRRMKEMFLDNSEYADVKFLVQGAEIYANKLVLCARSDVMSAMFDGSFIESRKSSMDVTIPDVTSECFLALLDYLYSDQFPKHIAKEDHMAVMMVADAYCERRLLNLCELFIANEVKNCDTDNLENSDFNVIELVESSKVYNGNQLSAWCLHFIACNYLIFEKMNDFYKLTGNNRKYVEEHRWPPTFYFEELKTYEQQIAKIEGKEKCLIM